MKISQIGSLCALLLFSKIANADFLWGVANAAFQVEGSPQPSDWLKWTKTPGLIKDGSNADVAVDFWNRYEEDITLAEKLGSKAFRISLAWERIEPQKNIWNSEAIARYRAIIKSIRHHNMEPIVTLHHFVLPLWVSEPGGLTSDEFPDEFAVFAEKCVQELSDPITGATYWMTFNEPNILVMVGYLAGEWPPGYKGEFFKAIQAMNHLIEAHKKAFTRVKNLNKAHVKIGIAHHWREFQAKYDRILDKIGRFLGEKYFNRYFVDGIQADGSTLDYIGINYYGRTIMTGTLGFPFIRTDQGPGDVNDIGWEIYPSGLKDTLKAVYDRYKLPIIISENGLADHLDAKRSQFVANHVASMKSAMDEGVPVIGYLHWSLTDNFEWAQGLRPRFGLVAMDYDKKATRIPRPSYFSYQKLISDTKFK